MGDFSFLALGREFHSGFGVSGPAEACEIGRVAARSAPGVEHRVMRRGTLLAAYTLVGKRLIVRMP